MTDRGFDGITIGGNLNYLQRQHIMRYVFAAQYVKSNDWVLDAACGAGYGTYYLAERAFEGKVYGLDISEAALAVAKRYYTRSNIEYLRGDVLKLPFSDGSFDVVVSFETIEHVEDGDAFLAEMRRVLKPDGLFICSTPNIEYTFHPRFHVREYYPEEFFKLLERHFSKVQRFSQFESLEDRKKELRNRQYRQLRSLMVHKLPFKNQLRAFYHFIKRRGTISSNRVEPIYITSNLYFPFEAVTEETERTDAIRRIMIGVCANEESK